MDSSREPLHVLFICSRNQWRSPTAERVARDWDGVEARSAGTSSTARRTVNEAMLRWADVVFAMENKHLKRLRSLFPVLVDERTIHVLDIPDDYQFMDQELVDWIASAVPPLLEVSPQPEMLR